MERSHLAFIRNQFQYCSLICTFAVQGAITVPIGAAAAPAAFLGSLTSTGNIFKAIGSAAASVTGPADAAVTPLINNDVFLVVPKAFHALDVAVVEAFNVGGAVFTPGGFVQAVQNGRTNILDALNQPVGPPSTPTGATNILQVVSVEAINVTTAVAFQAGELLLAGVVQIPNAVAQELAQSGDPGAASGCRCRAGGPGRQRGERTRGLCREHRGDEHPQFVGRSVPVGGEVDGTVGPNADGQDRRAQGGTEEGGPARDEDGIRKPKRDKGLGSRRPPRARSSATAAERRASGAA